MRVVLLVDNFILVIVTMIEELTICFIIVKIQLHPSDNFLVYLPNIGLSDRKLIEVTKMH